MTTYDDIDIDLLAGEVDERTLRFNAYIDGELSVEERRLFAEQLDEDVEFSRDYKAFARPIQGLQAFSFEFAPPGFVSRVETRIRTRSRGRFFAENYLFGERLPYEVVAIMMIVVMATMYFFVEVPKDKHMRDDTAGAPNLRLPSVSGSDN
jgi:anti-sigma-K factor RskA